MLATLVTTACTWSNVNVPVGVELVANSSPVPAGPLPYCEMSTYFLVLAL